VLPIPDPTTGLIKPGKTILKTYRLTGNICQRILAPGMPPPDEAHPNPVAEKKKDRLAKRSMKKKPVAPHAKQKKGV
jgi:hypothetical protein